MSVEGVTEGHGTAQPGPQGGSAPRSSILDRLAVKLLYRWVDGQTRGRSREISRFILKLFGIDWRPLSLGQGLMLPHATTGSVVHRATRIGKNVTIFHGVTIGRSNPHEPRPERAAVAEGVYIGDSVVVGANAVILFREGSVLDVGRGSVVGAGSVLLRSTGEGEVWAGNPAVKVGTRVEPT